MKKATGMNPPYSVIAEQIIELVENQEKRPVAHVKEDIVRILCDVESCERFRIIQSLKEGGLN